MSDATPPPSDGRATGGTPSDPYGSPTTSSPYGQPPSPYGGSGGTAGQYGQVAPARDPYLPDYGQHDAVGKRPGTVTGAAVTTLVLAGITAVFALIATIGLVVAKNDVLREMQKAIDKQDPNSSMNASTLYGAFVVVLVVLVLWALGSCLLAVFVLRRSKVARIMLIISASITALLSLLGLRSGVSIVTLLGAVVVIVLLCTGRARSWFKGNAASGGQQVPGQTIF